MNPSMLGGNAVAGGADDGGGRRRSLWKTPAVITALILLVPLLRNLYVYGWDWDFRGFLVVASFGTLIFAIGLAVQLFSRNLGTPVYRAAAGVALVAACLLDWSNFVQAADDVNRDAMTYLGVPIVAIIGAAIARFKPAGMARALFATALAQALVLAILLMIRNPQVTPWSAAVLRGFAMNSLLVVLFVGSAFLFRKAARVVSAIGAA